MYFEISKIFKTNKKLKSNLPLFISKEFLKLFLNILTTFWISNKK